MRATWPDGKRLASYEFWCCWDAFQGRVCGHPVATPEIPWRGGAYEWLWVTRANGYRRTLPRYIEQMEAQGWKVLNVEWEDDGSPLVGGPVYEILLRRPLAKPSATPPERPGAPPCHESRDRVNEKASEALVSRLSR